MNFSSWTNPEHSSAPHADFVCVNMLETTYIDSRDKRHWPLSLFQYGQTHGYRWPHWKWWFSSGFQGIPPKFSSTSISNKAKDDSDVETENKTWNDSSTLWLFLPVSFEGSLQLRIHITQSKMELFEGWNKSWTCRFNEQLEEEKKTIHITMPPLRNI